MAYVSQESKQFVILYEQVNAMSICLREGRRHILIHHCCQQQVPGHQRKISQKIFQRHTEHLHAVKNPIHHEYPAERCKVKLFSIVLLLNFVNSESYYV